MRFIASGNTLRLLEKLFGIWCNWENLEDYYLYELLPQLKRDLKEAQDNEKLLMKEIEKKASLPEWERLEWIAQNLEIQKCQWQEFSKGLDESLKKVIIKGLPGYHLSITTQS